MSTRDDVFDDIDFDGDDTGFQAEQADPTPTPGDQPAQATEQDVDALLNAKVADLSPEQKKVRQEHLDREHMPTVDAFKAEADRIAGEADTSTGTVSEAGKSAILAAYRGVTGGIKYKNLAKDYLQATMTAKVKGKEFVIAVAYSELSETLADAPAEARAASRPTVDPKIAHGERIAALQLASQVLVEQAEDDEKLAGLEVPDTQRAYGEVNEFLTWEADESEDKGEAPELSSIAAITLKLVKGKGIGGSTKSGGTRERTYNGPPRSVANHIAEAFADVEPGTFLTVSQIAGFSSSEYGDDNPSSGAVSARLKSARGHGVEGIQEGSNAEGTYGATKL